METDKAGLRLIRTIRDVHWNDLVRLGVFFCWQGSQVNAPGGWNLIWTYDIDVIGVNRLTQAHLQNDKCE